MSTANQRRAPLSHRTDSIGFRTFIGSVAAIVATSLAIGYASTTLAERALRTEQEHAFGATIAARGAGLEQYFATMRGHVASIAEDPSTAEALRDFAAGFASVVTESSASDANLGSIAAGIAAHHDRELAGRFRDNGLSWHGGEALTPPGANARLLQDRYIVANPNAVGSKQRLDSAGCASTYDRTHAAHHPRLRTLLERFGYYDIFLFDASGNAVYTVFKETDFATSVHEAPYASSNLSKLVRSVLTASPAQQAQACDFAPYAASYGAPAGFIAAPIVERGSVIGAVAVQIPIDRIDQICNLPEGLGESGELVLVGADTLPASGYQPHLAYSLDPGLSARLLAVVDARAAVPALRIEPAVRGGTPPEFTGECVPRVRAVAFVVRDGHPALRVEFELRDGRWRDRVAGSDEQPLEGVVVATAPTPSCWAAPTTRL